MRHEPPTSAGEMLLEEFIIPKIAFVLKIPTDRLSEILDGAHITEEEAHRLASYSGTTLGFWKNLQAARDQYYKQGK